MKKTLATSLLVCAAASYLCGCASEKGQQTAKISQSNQAAEVEPVQPPKIVYPGEDRLKLGMTTAEVVKAIGSPLGTGTESDGSQFWTYNHWTTPPSDAHLTPVNPKVLVLTVIFNRDGRVLNWYSSAQNEY